MCNGRDELPLIRHFGLRAASRGARLACEADGGEPLCRTEVLLYGGKRLPGTAPRFGVRWAYRWTPKRRRWM